MAAAGGAGITGHDSATGRDTVAHDARNGSRSSGDSRSVGLSSALNFDICTGFYLGDRGRLFLRGASIGRDDLLSADHSLVVRVVRERTDQRHEDAEIDPVPDRNQLTEYRKHRAPSGHE